MPMGVYITFSELFDRLQSWEEIIASVNELPVLTAAVTLMRIKMVLRFALPQLS